MCSPTTYNQIRHDMGRYIDNGEARAFREHLTKDAVLDLRAFCDERQAKGAQNVVDVFKEAMRCCSPSLERMDWGKGGKYLTATLKCKSTKGTEFYLFDLHLKNGDKIHKIEVSRHAPDMSTYWS